MAQKEQEDFEYWKLENKQDQAENFYGESNNDTDSGSNNDSDHNYPQYLQEQWSKRIFNYGSTYNYNR